MDRVDNKVPGFVSTRVFRRLVLGTAFFLGLAVALAPRAPAVYAQEPKSATPPPAAQKAPEVSKSGKSMTIKDGRGAEIKIDIGEGGKTSVTESGKADSDTDVGAPQSKGGRKRAEITIDGLGDKEFDSFDEFVRDEPALAAMVVAIVATVFFAPVVAIALILWYRMRKARMLNETMLKLAEKGIVPSAAAIDALGGKQAAAAAVAPYYEQAKQVRARAAWSDLRKGVLMAGFGFALLLHSLMTSSGPNVVGLVLLFVGLGFVVLWWFEQRHLPVPGSVLPSVTPGPGSLPPGSQPPT
jgi:hypothetical protein